MENESIKTDGISARQANTGNRRRRILDAALACFLEQGIEETTIEHIRQVSGASHGSIYHHFGSKEAIALALYVEGMREYQQRVMLRLNQQTNVRDGVRSIVIEHLASVAADPPRSMYMTRIGTADVSEAAAEHIAEVNQELYRSVHAWLLPYIERGEIKRLPPALYVSLIIGSAAHLARHWLANRVSVDLLEVAEPLADAAWESLAPR